MNIQSQFTVSEIAKELGVSSPYVHHLRRELRIDPIGKASPNTKALVFNTQHFLFMKLAMKMKEAMFSFPRIREAIQLLAEYDFSVSVIVADRVARVVGGDFTQIIFTYLNDVTYRQFKVFKINTVFITVAI